MAALAATACVSTHFAGLKALPAKTSSFKAQTKVAMSRSRVTCDANTFQVITASTATTLFLGRLAFLPIQRHFNKEAGLPKQNGVTHFDAGDSRAQEVEGILKTNDPAGFTIVDTLAWGAIGHAIGFFILATAFNGYEPKF
eukprot:jgi/Mesen1/10640/ME000894S10209